MSACVIKNIGELVTNQPLAEGIFQEPSSLESLGAIKGAWLAFEDGKIKAYGKGSPPAKWEGVESIDANGGLVLPGLVDCHTHPIFGGDRAAEFSRRLSGESYQSIAEKGGGILYSIKATRDASNESLERSTKQNLEQFLLRGVTTVEAKTGYGQTPAEELRMLKILQKLNSEIAQTLSITCMGLHAVPSEYPSTKAFVKDMTENLLPKIAESKLADYVDAFVEDGYFTVEQVEPYMQKAMDLGIKRRIHADEFKESQAASAAGKWKCLSADHLQQSSVQGQKEMAAAGTIAVVLPGTSLYTAIPFTNASQLVASGCLVAIASDFNPGSCYINNLPMIASSAALHCKLNVSQTIAGVTYIAAKALELEKKKGALAVGYDADFIIYQLPSKEHWLSNFGQTDPKMVYIGGKKVVHKDS